MKEMQKLCERMENELLARMRGSLTSSGLSAMLDSIRRTARKHLDATSELDKREMVAHAKEYVPRKNLTDTGITPEIVVEAVAMGVMIDEYFMTLTSIPELKAQLWAELEKDGITYAIWLNIQEAFRSSQGA